MKYLITGNLGYVGPVLSKFIKANDDEAYIIGYDIGYFVNSRIASEMQVEPSYIDKQIYADVRDFHKLAIYIKEVDHVIHLAAISNDPMGKEFENVTKDINQESSIFMAHESIANNCKSFVFASSCSVYGEGGDKPRTEDDPVNPLTAYAKSKIGTENILKTIKNKANTKISCLRFATACGYSPNLRLDLVLNDFVSSALTTNTIQILSDGSPWRPLIDVLDMARAILWACKREKGENFEIINVGSNEWNYKIIELATAVQKIINNNIVLDINKNAMPDKRSYKVNFKKFFELATDEYTPKISLLDSVEKLLKALLPYRDRITKEKRKYLIRLEILKNLKNKNILNDNLKWNH